MEEGTDESNHRDAAPHQGFPHLWRRSTNLNGGRVVGVYWRRARLEHLESLTNSSKPLHCWLPLLSFACCDLLRGDRRVFRAMEDQAITESYYFPQLRLSSIFTLVLPEWPDGHWRIRKTSVLARTGNCRSGVGHEQAGGGIDSLSPGHQPHASVHRRQAQVRRQTGLAERSIDAFAARELLVVGHQRLRRRGGRHRGIGA